MCDFKNVWTSQDKISFKLTAVTYLISTTSELDKTAFASSDTLFL